MLDYLQGRAVQGAAASSVNYLRAAGFGPVIRKRAWIFVMNVRIFPVITQDLIPSL